MSSDEENLGSKITGNKRSSLRLQSPCKEPMRRRIPISQSKMPYKRPFLSSKIASSTKVAPKAISSQAMSVSTARKNPIPKSNSTLNSTKNSNLSSFKTTPCGVSENRLSTTQKVLQRKTPTAGSVNQRTNTKNAVYKNEEEIVEPPSNRPKWDIKGRYFDFIKAKKKEKEQFEAEKKELTEKCRLIEETSIINTKKITELDELLEKEIQQNMELKSKLDMYEDQIRNHNNQVTELNNRLNEEKVRSANLESQLHTITNKYNILTANFNKLHKEHESLKNSSSIVEKILEETKIALSNTRDEVDRLERTVISCKRQLGEQDFERRKLHHKLLELKGTVRVACRIRPMLSQEDGKPTCLLEYNMQDNQMKISSNFSKDSVTGVKVEANNYFFKFDNFFGAKSTQKHVFEEIEPLVQSALDGYNVCIFAYGQTGSGKTFTMEGVPSCDEFSGMIPRSVRKIFESMPALELNGWKYTVTVSFIEIYNENLRDLLESSEEKSSKNKPAELKIIQSSAISQDKKCNDVEVSNLKVVQVLDYEQVFDLLNLANRNRTVGATKCNINSSRSHSVFQMKLVGVNEIIGETSIGKVNLVDLAGSERLKESQAEGIRLQETKHINSSLSTLRKVMKSLYTKDAHIPFRDSKLTYLLQSSLAGNSKSLMFVNISPLEEHFAESLNSLRFASTVGEIQIGVATQQKKKIAY